jgi:hypothetical protein
MINESQKAAFLLGATATVGAWIESKGFGSGLLSSFGLSGQMTDIAIGLAIAGAGFYLDGEWGDYLIAFGTGYVLASVL